MPFCRFVDLAADENVSGYRAESTRFCHGWYMLTSMNGKEMNA